MKALKKIADECLLTDLKCFRAGLVGEIQGWNHLGSDKMKNTSFGFLAFLFLVLGTSSTTLVAGNQDGAEPYLLKGQFELPLNIDEIREQWTVLGYRECLIQRKHKGWTSDRPERLKGEHTHPWYTLFAGKMGKMEFIIQGQRHRHRERRHPRVRRKTGLRRSPAKPGTRTSDGMAQLRHTGTELGNSMTLRNCNRQLFFCA